MFKKWFDRRLLSLIGAALGAGILAALILPFWFLVVCLALILIMLGFSYIKC
ncbi:MAG: hypothetical protein GX800_13550 [Clostridiaceae bacterium]|nr:hypothetical protein [Clostridiaceae bacterium]